MIVDIDSPIEFFELSYCNYKPELIENLKKKPTLIRIQNNTSSGRICIYNRHLNK